MFPKMFSKKSTQIEGTINFPNIDGRKAILLTTKGFNDILSNNDQHKYKPFLASLINKIDLFDTIIEVDESIDENGQITRELFEHEINKAMRQVFKAKPETIVIALLNSDRNPLHEKIFKNLLFTAGYTSILTAHK
jgi:5-oxoprolinase (ATP-hydrolysing)